MQLLVDSHALIWAVDSPDLLTSTAQTALKDATNQLFLSAATIWEIAIKVGTGKLSLALPYLHWMNRAIGDLSLTIPRDSRLRQLPSKPSHSSSRSFRSALDRTIRRGFNSHR